MPCSSCTSNGNTVGCPCQEVKNDACPPTFPAGKTVYRDHCTGETKTALPYVTKQANDFEMVAVKVVPKQTTGSCKAAVQPCQQRKCCTPERRTQCYTCGPKRTDCYPWKRRCYELKYLDAFENFDVGQCEENAWNYFTNTDDFTADDGRFRKANDGLILTAKEFKKTYAHKGGKGDKRGALDANGFLDHYKTFVVLNSDFEVPDCGEVYFEACMAGRTYNTEKHPFGDHVLNPNSDLRLGFVLFCVIDFDSGLLIGHVLTNDSIYALYERLPLDNDDGNDDDVGSAAFASAKLIGRRNYRDPMKDFARLGIALDKREGALWYIDGVQKHQATRLGHLPDPAEVLYQIGGEPDEVQLKCVHVGFAMGTMLDAVHPMNYRDIDAAGTGLVRLTDFRYQHPWVHNREVQFVNEDNRKECRLWGQGAALKVKELKVELRC